MTPFFGEVRIDPFAEPGLLVAPFQALTDEDRADPAAAHGDALVGQIGHQPIQQAKGKPSSEGWVRAAVMTALRCSAE